MSSMLMRILAYFTFVAYLIVGTAAVRFLLPKKVHLSFNTQYYSVFTVSSIRASTLDAVSAPEIVFSKIEIPQDKVKIAQVKKVSSSAKKVVIRRVEKKIVVAKLPKNELPFGEIIKISAVRFGHSLPVNLVALYKDIKIENQVMVAASGKANAVADEVSTSMAKNSVADDNAEPEFFEYPQKTATKEEVVVKTKEAKTNEKVKNEIEEASSENLKTEESSSAIAYEEVSLDDLVTYDYSKPSIEKTSTPVTATQSNENYSVTGTVSQGLSTQDAVSFNFNYPKALQDTKSRAAAVASAQSGPLTTHLSEPVSGEIQDLVEGNKTNNLLGKNALTAPAGYPTKLTIQMSSMDLKKVIPLAGFEVRFQDDQSVSIEDYGSSEVVLIDTLAEPKMTRSVTLLKRGHAPVNTDVILEEGESQVSIPTIAEEVFNKLIEPYESRGAVGALLVELDDKTELAQLDVPFGRVLTLDGDLKETKKDDFRYQLFIGVQAGNAFLTYKSMSGDKVSKIVHIHERELTFDANYYEKAGAQKITLLEEDLLGKDHSPLIVASDDVKVFSTNSTATKMDDRSYQLDFNETHLGGRQYIELAHQSEPVFIGLRDNKTILVPSENFMRYILSNFEGGKLGNRCIVQVNLSKKVEKVDVGSESVGSNLMAYTQVLDTDGKFYESTSEKTQKIIILGENQGAPGTNQDGRIDIRLQYLDGTTQYLNTYCSPNSYLVEQL